MILAVAGFLGCSLLIFYHGRKLAHYGDLISIKSGWGKVWVGLILMASVTSLPELVIGTSSVTLVGSADLAVGNVLGSCVFNLAILSLLDAIIPGQPILTKVARSNVLAATLGSILLAFVGIGLFLSNEIRILNWIGITSLVFVIVYFVSVRLLHTYGLRENSITGASVPDQSRIKLSLSSLFMWYAVHAVMVIIAALALPYFSEQIAAESGIGESFIGTLLLAASSSLPEIAVSISAARMGNTDMAVGNLFGSNIFNIMLLAIFDLFYEGGNILQDASESNMITVFATIIMNSIAIAGFTMRPEKKGLRFLAWDTALILIVYVLTIVFLYFYS
jgi:cation:H+ antiporter